MTPNEKTIIAEFIHKQERRIRGDRKAFDAKEMTCDSDNLCQKLKTAGTNPATAHQHVEDALRYVAFLLADCALHSQANQVGMLLNIHRMKCQRALGKGWLYIRTKKLFGSIMGFTHSPGRLALFVVGVWLTFVALYGGISCVTDKPVIRAQDRTCVVWYHYPYFSAVTLATLGYGDFAPNLDHPYAGFVCSLASLEALMGYVVLGLLVGMVLGAGLHPYARLGCWLDQYAHATVGAESKARGDSNLYDPDWPGYTMARSIESTDKHGNSKNSSDAG